MAHVQVEPEIFKIIQIKVVAESDFTQFSEIVHMQTYM